MQPHNKRRQIEVLAPAGSLEHVSAAIAAGADAFYVGLEGLSARPHPWSLSLSGIRTAARMAHDAGRRIHVAVNAEFHTRQDAEVARALEAMTECGVDALIVGDFGLLHYLKSLGNTLSVHASTLLGIYNAEGIRLLQREYGVTRVVLNTNLYIDEIADLHFLCRDVELEMIAHGGVCFNDNRRCRQPHYLFEGEFCVGCKQLYETHSDGQGLVQLQPVSPVASQVRWPEVPPEGDRIIWSPEIDLSDIVGLFIKVGVVSFKIEGRTRDAEYIASSTSKMREAVERALSSEDLSDAELNRFFYLAHPSRLGQER
jgi:U32 family peptidase